MLCGMPLKRKKAEAMKYSSSLTRPNLCSHTQLLCFSATSTEKWGQRHLSGKALYYSWSVPGAPRATHPYCRADETAVSVPENSGCLPASGALRVMLLTPSAATASARSVLWSDYVPRIDGLTVKCHTKKMILWTSAETNSSAKQEEESGSGQHCPAQNTGAAPAIPCLLLPKELQLWDRLPWHERAGIWQGSPVCTGRGCCRGSKLGAGKEGSASCCLLANLEEGNHPASSC
ncbi:ras-related protein Ral-B isoform X1 [Tympanuchus pallidicinctus]|uniref:ras-related protein Ral-B isoform X1 n=1 Tax=Tympanuchus pallidicinctus TaxID=109042 RepID=UPI00228753DE|nr:ras-related protein Ral-B isoform X1 [Tympanuchus pallidicinctus]XP_052532377.1 ras-related protein Ral-B isoform X1 [Tympanuchus pallidicinctus]